MLEEIRKKRGITQKFIAKKLNISRDRLSRIEKGISELPTRFLPVLKEHYGISYQELIDISKEIKHD